MEKKMGYVLATRMLVDEKRRVRFMYREAAEGQDSGWRFFCGLEGQAYADDPDNIGVYDIKTILAIDPSIAPYLDSPEGMAYEREEDDQPFGLASDFDFEPEDEEV